MNRIFYRLSILLKGIDFSYINHCREETYNNIHQLHLFALYNNLHPNNILQDIYNESNISFTVEEMYIVDNQYPYINLLYNKIINYTENVINLVESEGILSINTKIQLNIPEYFKAVRISDSYLSIEGKMYKCDVGFFSGNYMYKDGIIKYDYIRNRQ